MLMPKRVKWRKVSRGKMRGKSKGASKLDFGDYGLQALQAGWITNRQIEAARIAIARSVRRGGKMWIRIFPDKPYTKKPAETRMGSGKGSPEGWVAVVKPGRILFEMSGTSHEVAKAALRLAGHKLPIPCKIVSRHDFPDHAETDRQKDIEIVAHPPKFVTERESASQGEAVSENTEVSE